MFVSFLFRRRTSRFATNADRILTAPAPTVTNLLGSSTLLVLAALSLAATDLATGDSRRRASEWARQTLSDCVGRGERWDSRPWDRRLWVGQLSPPGRRDMDDLRKRLQAFQPNSVSMAVKSVLLLAMAGWVLAPFIVEAAVVVLAVHQTTVSVSGGQQGQALASLILLILCQTDLLPKTALALPCL